MRRLALLLGLCLLLAFSASGMVLVGTAEAVSHDHAAEEHSIHEHPAIERLADCPEGEHDADCLATDHCLSGTASRYTLANAPAEAYRPPPLRRRLILSPSDRLERPPRTA